ncbi:SusC/RagA family TonB-linked outer membrane protein [Mucilaginibacter celer]|uniref:SusC/RagA family TonB-linked outer membrane protein n=1 Tax=Mucilaginibacter celer TaxID=2305508 RepID=A0A494VXV2_9SPHI|nr:SusC/RagA family TonB-linked outer membrane protein [Mucilaginibacter celer]AYL96158.1 SusC/RagA family TonB-linked outer membrane protein [Mucilaginibacter celer]
MKQNLLKISRLLLLFVVCLFTYSNLQAQSLTIRGIILDDANQPLPGVSVRIKGTNTGTVTGIEGRFTIAATKGDVLTFNFVGYASQEVTIGTETYLSIQMKSDSKSLTEVVVTALGVKKEVRRIGYSSQDVKGEELTKAREPNAINSLVGKVAGLNVGVSAELLGRPQLVLRGSTDLLFVVDGVPINSDTFNISADDVETYTVLKGPNAAALYGFRGQNGAILITTKRGTKDKRGFSIDLNSSTMLEKGLVAVPKNQTDYGYGTAYAYDYGSGLYSTAATAGSGSFRANIWGPKFDGQPVRQYDSPIDPVTGIRGTSPWLARGKNNYENFIETGLLSNTNLAIGASGELYDLRASYAHNYQKGTGPNTGLNADNLNLSLGYKISNKLRVDGNLNFNTQYSKNIPDAGYGPNSYPYMFKVYGSASWDVRDMEDYYKAPAGNPLGKPGVTQYYAEYGRENNPYFVANEWLRGHYKTDVYGYLKLTYSFNKDLNLAVRSQVTTWDQLRTEKVPSSTVLNSYLAPSGSPFKTWDATYTGDFRQDHRNLIENNTDVLLSYNKTIKDFNISALAGANSRSYKYVSDWSSTNWLQSNGSQLDNAAYSLNNSKNSAARVYAYNANMQVYSAYYSVDIGYKNYFTLSTTGRVDKTSTLPSGNNTFFYPSVALSSVISDYVKFPEVISFLKVRASWADVKGALTSSTIPSAYAASTNFTKTVNSGLLGYGTELYSSYDGPSYANQLGLSSGTYYNGTSSIAISNTLANPKVNPFDVGSYEGGLDVKFFNNRLSFAGTYFRTVNGPSIFPLGIPSSTLYYAHTENAVTSLKKGFELSLDGAVIRNPNGFSWNILVNYSTFKETLKDIYGDEKSIPINNHVYKIGDRLDGYYGIKFLRSPDGQIINNSAGIPLPSQSGIDNLQYLGHLNPDFSFGINNKFSYKAFSLSFQFDGRVGGKIYDEVYSRMMNAGTAIETVQGAYGAARLADWNSLVSTGKVGNNGLGSYVGPGVVIASGTPKYANGVISNLNELTFAPNTVPTTVQNYASNGLFNQNIDEAFLISRTYAKLREVTIGYTIPQKFLGKSFIRRASITLVGRNLLYFAARKDIDLDQYASGFNLSTLGTQGVKGLSSDLQSSTSRRYGVNLNFGF